jgi:hypothetical protein
MSDVEYVFTSFPHRNGNHALLSRLRCTEHIGVMLELRQHGTTKCGYVSNAVISILALLCPCGTECIVGNFFAGRSGHG